jgi:hypothetical protein
MAVDPFAHILPVNAQGNNSHRGKMHAFLALRFRHPVDVIRITDAPRAPRRDRQNVRPPPAFITQ